MGSLHEGHIKLIEKCSMKCDETIVSIFVNPTQFTNKTDLVNYPQSIKKDIQTIKKINENAIVYTPLVSDLYSSPVKSDIIYTYLCPEFYDEIVSSLILIATNSEDVGLLLASSCPFDR